MESAQPLACAHHVPHNVTFTTGLITTLLASVGAGLVIHLANIFSIPLYKSAIVPIYSIILTTVVPAYWIWANNDLWSFTIRHIRNFVNKDM